MSELAKSHFFLKSQNEKASEASENKAPIDPRIQEEIKKLFRFFAKDHDEISFP